MINVVKGKNNVFEDLGFEPAAAANLKIRADLMIELQKFIRCQKWTQSEAAEFFKETQPRISNLMNGDIDRFSIDKLVQMLAQADLNVRVSIAPKAA